jgi:hypothetical protein
MRRVLLSAAVQVKAPPTAAKREAAALMGVTLTVYTPTHAEMMDAVAKVRRELEDLKVAKGYSSWTEDWEATESGLIPFTTPEGEVGVRGYLVVKED